MFSWSYSRRAIYYFISHREISENSITVPLLFMVGQLIVVLWHRTNTYCDIILTDCGIMTPRKHILWHHFDRLWYYDTTQTHIVTLFWPIVVLWHHTNTYCDIILTDCGIMTPHKHILWHHFDRLWYYDTTQTHIVTSFWQIVVLWHHANTYCDIILTDCGIMTPHKHILWHHFDRLWYYDTTQTHIVTSFWQIVVLWHHANTYCDIILTDCGIMTPRKHILWHHFDRLWYYDTTQTHIVLSFWPIVLRTFLGWSHAFSRCHQVITH